MTDNVLTDENTPATFDVLANDSDVDGNTIFITDVTQGGSGTVAFTANDISYTPNADYWGTDQFSYTISDGNGGTATTDVNVTVKAPLVATDDDVSTDEDTPATFDVLANDSGIDSGSTFITDVTQGANGEVDFTDSDLSYTPNPDYHGADQFTYTISNIYGDTATAYVNVTVNSVNDDPVAVDDNVSLNEDTTDTFDVLTNDSDVDGDTLSITDITQGFSGTVSFTATNVSYTPYQNFNGTDQFSYTISDGNGGIATTDVNVTVNPVNDPPVANADSITTDEDVPVTIYVLDNDTDIDFDNLFITAVTQGGNGTVTFTSHDLTYTPAKDWSGSDQFTYMMKDGHGGMPTATVNVTVNPVEDWPVANTDYEIIGKGGSVIINLIGNDSDAEGPVTVIRVDTSSYFASSYGVDNITDNDDGTATYNNWVDDPNPYPGAPTGYSVGTGGDTFSYDIIDSAGNITSGLASIYVDDPDSDNPPIARPDYTTTMEDTPVTFNVLGNDWDDLGFTIQGASTGDSGATVSWDSLGNITYTPAQDFHGTGSVTYYIYDSSQQVAWATLNIEVTPVNDPPHAVLNAAWTGWKQTIRISVLDGATDVERDALEPGNELIVTNAFGALKGKTAIIGGTYVEYTPNADFTTGYDTFTYTVDDGHGGSDTESVTVTMVQITDWSVQYKDSDGNWIASPHGEAVWSHEELRWKATYGPTPPNGPVRNYWIAQDWDAFKNNDDRSSILPFASYDPLGTYDIQNDWAYGNPGVGIWAILPQINFAPPHQSDFVAQMDKAAVEQVTPKGQGDAKILSIQWRDHYVFTLEDKLTDAKFFPDATSATGPLRNLVDVFITITPNIETTLYLKAFDVDDPSDDDGPIDADTGPTTVDSADNIKTPGAMGADFTIDASGQTVQDDLPNSKVATLRKTLTINRVQPGNNYRVAVSPRNTTDLNKLKPASMDAESRLFYENITVNNTKDAGEPFVDQNTINNFGGMRITPRLTVWRILHVESDWMAEPSQNEKNLIAAGVDDEYPWNGPLPPVSMELLVSGFEPAYIKVVVGTPNDNEFAWDHYMTGAELVKRAGDRGTDESAAYWVAQVESAYEAATNLDGDVDNVKDQNIKVLVGLTFRGYDIDPNTPAHQEDPAHKDISAIYLEAIRDFITTKNPGLAGADLQAAILRYQERIVLHEIGHQFVGAGHVTDDVMATGAGDPTVDPMGNFEPKFEKFNQTNLQIIRSILQP